MIMKQNKEKFDFKAFGQAIKAARKAKGVSSCRNVSLPLCRRYFKDILEYDSYENLFTSVARLLVREKKRDSRKTVSVKNFKALL